MLVDAETLLLAPASPEIVAAADAELGPGRIKTELFASVVESNSGVCDSAGEAAARLRELREAAARLAGERGLAGLRRRGAPDQPARGAGDRARGPLPRVRRVRGHLGAAAGGQRAARPRRHARRGDVLARARGRAALAARRARALGQLALPVGRGDRARVQPRRDPRPAAAQRRAAGVSRPRRVGGVRRPAGRARASSPTTRCSGGTCARTRASGRSRCGCRTSRRRRRRYRGPGCARPGALRARPREGEPRRTTRRRGRSTSRTAGPRSGPGSTPGWCTPTATGRRPARELSSGGARRGRARLRAASRDRPRPDGGRGAARDRRAQTGLEALTAALVERTLR